METKPLDHWLVLYLLRFGPTPVEKLAPLLVSEPRDIQRALNTVRQRFLHKPPLLKYDADVGWYVYDPQAARQYLIDPMPSSSYLRRWHYQALVRTAAGYFFAADLPAATKQEAYAAADTKADELATAGETVKSLQVYREVAPDKFKKESRMWQSGGRGPSLPRRVYGPRLDARTTRIKPLVLVDFPGDTSWENMIRVWEDTLGCLEEIT